MPVDDENAPNPQRAEVLRLERRKIQNDVWLQARIEATLVEAASIALCPNTNMTAKLFSDMAHNAYVTAVGNFNRHVAEEILRREQSLASETPPTKPGEHT